eukprot:8353333-Pyramimonas_sp.AAC.1
MASQPLCKCGLPWHGKSSQPLPPPPPPPASAKSGRTGKPIAEVVGREKIQSKLKPTDQSSPKVKASGQVETDSEQGQDFKVRLQFKLLISDVFQQHDPQVLDQLD